MIYVVKSDTSALREKIVNKLISTNNISEGDISIFDYEESKTIEEALFEYLSLSFDSEPKAIILKNASIINSTKVEKEIEEHFVRALEADVKNILILTTDKLNKTGKLNKKYSDRMTVLEKDAPKKGDLRAFIKTFFENNDMNVEAGVVDNIFERLGENFDLIVSELNKLEILYKDIITNELVNKTVLDFSRQRLYKIADYVFTKDINGVQDIIKQLISEGETIFMLGDALNRVGSNFLRYMILKEKGYSDSQINSITGWNPWLSQNYSKYAQYWKNSDEVYNFYYETILESSFFDMIEFQPANALKQLERLLMSALAMEVK